MMLTDHFSYLQRRTDSVSAGEDRQRFAEVCNALDLVGFEYDSQRHIFTCLAAVLHLGNIDFYEDANEYAHILSPFSGPVKMASVRACCNSVCTLWSRPGDGSMLGQGQV